MANIDHEKARELIQKCTALHYDLIAAGFHVTARKMHETVQQIGWEYANKLDGKSPIEGDSVSGLPVAGESTVRVYNRRMRKIERRPV